MSTETSGRAKRTLKIVRNLLEKAEASTQKALEKAPTAVQKSIDTSLEAAAKGFNATIQSIDEATVEDQVKLLKVYKKFLGGQEEYVDSRIKDLEQKRQQD